MKEERITNEEVREQRDSTRYHQLRFL